MSTNWLPGTRVGQLAMAKLWAAVLTDKAAEWHIDLAREIEPFKELIAPAEAALEKVQDKSSRTHVDSVNCETAFKALAEKMRYIKNNFFNSPPRTAGDLALLELSPRDPPSDIKPPLSVVGVKSRPLANGLIEALMETVGDSAKDSDASYYGYRVFVGIEDAGGEGKLSKFGKYLVTPPQSGTELTYSFYTKRKRDVVQCDEPDRGKKLWLCVKLENGKGQTGPWGPLFWTIIP